MANTPEAKPVAGEQTLEVYWGSAEHLEPIFADNLHLQRIGDLFYLTFGQVRVPVLEGEQTKRLVAEIHPMARMIVPKAALDRIADLLHRTLGRGEGK